MRSTQLHMSTAIQNKKTFIFVKFQKEGIHCYPQALTDELLKTGDWDDVSFLGYPHRHIFHVKLWVEVFHDDRDIEFIQIKRYITRSLEQGTINFNSKSCEMISDDLYNLVNEKYPNRDIKIEVSEDDENGSYTEYSK